MKKKRKINKILSILIAFILIICGININFSEEIILASSAKTSNMLAECMPYYLEDSTIEDRIVMGNVTYSDAIKVSLDSDSHERRIGFNLSRLYTSLSFEVGHIDGTGTANDNIVMSIYKDGELCDNYDLSINDIAKKITCDVLGVSQFEIVITYDYYTGIKGYFGIGALNFQRSGDETSNGREIESEFLTYCPPYSYDESVLNQTLVMGGVTYTNAIKVSLDSDSKQRRIAFNLQEKYNSVAFNIGHIDGTGLANGDIVLSLYGDGIFMDSYDLQLNDIPKLIFCDTTGISQFEIVVDYDYYTGVKGYFGIGALKGTSITKVEIFKIDSSVKGAVGEELEISGTLTLSQDSHTSSSILSSEVDAIKWTIKSDSNIIDLHDFICKGINAADNRSATLMITVIPQNEGVAVITGEASNGLKVSCTITVEQQKDENESEDYQYKELNNDTIKITGYTGTAKELVIPAKIDGKSVIYIGDSAFEDYKSLSSVKLSEGITSIGDNAFSKCSNLRSIKLSESITSIGNGAFGGCSSLSNIKLPEELKTIGEWAFSYCSSLSSIELPKRVTSVEDSAFAGCRNLSSIKFPVGLREIANDAFLGCSNLNDIELPKEVYGISYRAFLGCSSLTEFIVDSGNETYTAQDGILYKDGKTLVCCPGGKIGDIKLPEGITEIGNYAFYSCDKLNSVKLPEGVTDIGYGAFGNCNNLTLIIIKNSYAESYAKENELKYSYSGLCSHNYKIEIIAPPTCTTKGEKTYTCTECGYSYKASIPTEGHNYQQKITKATTKKNGKCSEVCIKCGDIKSTTIIYAAKTVKLSKTSYIYSGKAQKPFISIKDSKGKTLKNMIDYTIYYDKGRKNVGLYSVKIKFKGAYQGTLKKNFTIVPKSTSITKLAPQKKGFTVKWKKQDNQTTGYEITYSTSQSFTKKTTRTVIVNNNKSVSKSIEKLKAKKNYYVRIRTYKNVKTGGKTKKFYSGWSKLKQVITKK